MCSPLRTKWSAWTCPICTFCPLVHSIVNNALSATSKCLFHSNICCSMPVSVKPSAFKLWNSAVKYYAPVLPPIMYVGLSIIFYIPSRSVCGYELQLGMAKGSVNIPTRRRLESVRTMSCNDLDWALKTILLKCPHCGLPIATKFVQRSSFPQLPNGTFCFIWRNPQTKCPTLKNDE